MDASARLAPVQRHLLNAPHTFVSAPQFQAAEYPTTDDAESNSQLSLISPYGSGILTKPHSAKMIIRIQFQILSAV